MYARRNVPFTISASREINMPGLLKELLLDYALHRLPIDQRNDLTTAIASLYRAGVIKRQDIIILDLYISGYTSKEIAVYIPNTDIDATLSRMLKAIESASGYTDNGFIHKVAALYSKERINKLTLFLIDHGNNFNTHEVERVIV